MLPILLLAPLCFVLGGVAAPRAAARHTTPRCCTAYDWSTYEWWEDGLTCVEYTDEADGAVKLGVYAAYSMIESEPHIRPLCAASEEEGVSALFCDEDVPAVPLAAVRSVLDDEYLYVTERQAGGGQGLGNPHGEHAEACYDFSDMEISDDVTLVVREGRDLERRL
jgi:hypothetical protein